MIRALSSILVLMFAALPATAPASGLEAPVCTFIPSLSYPTAVQDKSLSGDVLILVHLDDDGEVTNTEVLHSDLPPLFIVEARKAAQESRFLPARREGKKIESTITLPFHFEALVAPAPPVEEAADPVPSPSVEPEATAQTASAQDSRPVEEERRPVATEPEETEPEAPVEEESRSALVLLDGKFGRDANRSGVTGEADVFDEGGRVYFWTRIGGGSVGQQVLHVWNLNGRTVQIIELPVKGEDWRTWSFKTLYEGMAGEWTVEVWDESGERLGQRSFRCRAASEPE